MPIARIKTIGVTSVGPALGPVGESRIGRATQTGGGARDGPRADVLLCMPGTSLNGSNRVL
jgi:hypothetical protein